MSCGNSPDFINLCSAGVGDIRTIPDYCTESPLTACVNISPEWVYKSDSSCPCPSSATRRTVTCSRAVFAGNPERCCTLDLEQYPTDSSRCWSDSARKQTCDPRYRGPSQSGCRELFYTNCVYNPVSQADYSQAWSTGFCSSMVANSSRLPSGALNQAGLPWINTALSALFDKAFPSGFQSPGLSSAFQDQMMSLCQKYPEACRDGLDSYCKRYNRSQLEGNINAVKLCGCYLPDQEYAVYESLYSIPRTCDPFCANTQTVPLVGPVYEKEICTSNVCLIDNITVNLINSEGGNIGFTQVCGGCGGNTSCNCTISNVSITAVESTLGNINLKQECLGSLKCYTTTNGVSFEVPCTTNPVEEILGPRYVFWFVLIGFFVLLLVGLVILYVVTTNKKKAVVQKEVVYRSLEKSNSLG